MSPLHMAASWHKPEVVIALLKYKADASKVDVNGLAPLHCAAIYGDLLSVRSLVELGNVDVNERVSTPHGDMTPLDCVLECEDNEDRILELWQYLAGKGADIGGLQEYVLYPEPFPLMSTSRLLGVIATATRNRWQTRVASTKNFVTVYEQGTEDADALRKVSCMLKARMNPNDVDSFGRPALVLCSSEECTNLLIDHGALPDLTASPDEAKVFAGHYVKVHFLGTVADKTDQLRQVKYSETIGQAEMAERFSVIMATAKLELKQAYRRALCTASPLLEALAEGKLSKAEALILAGANPAVELPDALNHTVDFSDVLPESSQQYKQFERAFGRYVWKEISMQLLRLGSVTFSIDSQRGSQLVQSAYAKERMFKGLNLPQHKDHERRLSEMVAKLQEAEERFFDEFDPDESGPVGLEYPPAADLEACRQHAQGLLVSLNANPAARLLEEAVITNQPGAKIHVSTEPVSDVGRERPKSRIASEYFEFLKVGVEATETSEDQVRPAPARFWRAWSLFRGPGPSRSTATQRLAAPRVRLAHIRGRSTIRAGSAPTIFSKARELLRTRWRVPRGHARARAAVQAAGQVCEAESLARRSRGDSVVSTISSEEGWGSYRNRMTKSWHVDVYDDDDVRCRCRGVAACCVAALLRAAACLARLVLLRRSRCRLASLPACLGVVERRPAAHAVPRRRHHPCLCPRACVPPGFFGSLWHPRRTMTLSEGGARAPCRKVLGQASKRQLRFSTAPTLLALRCTFGGYKCRRPNHRTELQRMVVPGTISYTDDVHRVRVLRPVR